MVKKKTMELASRRVVARANRRTTRRRGFWARVWDIICMPFRWMARQLRRLWAWICSLNVIGLINAALLVAIIVLFSMLIIDIVNTASRPKIVVANVPAIAVKPTKPQVTVTTANAPESVVAQAKNKQTLPIKRDPVTRKYTGRTISVAERTKGRPAQKKLMGDVFIDRNPVSPVLDQGAHIRGNLYLQDMHKYTLPCGVQIEGNLFLRDVGMLQFCGDFTVKGNIYVSRRSSFGPIPRTARVGGQIIL